MLSYFLFDSILLDLFESRGAGSMGDRVFLQEGFICLR